MDYDLQVTMLSLPAAVVQVHSAFIMLQLPRSPGGNLLPVYTCMSSVSEWS